MRRWLLASALWVPAIAGAVDVEVVARAGALRAGLPSEIDVAIVDDQGLPAVDPPKVRVAGVDGVALQGDGAPGVFRFAVVAPAPSRAVEVDVSWHETHLVRSLAVHPVPPSGLLIEANSADARSGEARFTVRGTSLPDPEALRVATTEGRVVSVVPGDGGLVVTIATDSQPYPRLVLVGARDLRSDAPPSFATLRLRARLDVPVETEPGASVAIEVGGRTYGPVVVPESGRVSISVDQDPEDSSARVRVRDTSGNEAVRGIPLTTVATALLLAHAEGPRLPGGLPPDVVLHAIRNNGRSWVGAAPTCRAPAVGDLPLVAVSGGSWQLVMPSRLPVGTSDLRVRCDLGVDATTSFTVPVAPGVPVDLSVRVWPDVLSTDFPVADVAVSLLDEQGERLPMTGRLDLRADLGLVDMGKPEGTVVRGEYRGDLAAEVGEDTVYVSWRAPVGHGPVAALRVVGGPAHDHEASVLVRALDAQGLPLADRTVRVTVRDAVATVSTGVDGWVDVSVPWSVTDRVLHVEAESERVSVTTCAIPVETPTQGPGRPDRRVEVPVQVDPGRAAEIELTVTPEALVAGPKASAVVHARLLDRSGAIATTESPTLTTSDGSLVPLGLSPDGGWSWSFVPAVGFRERDVLIVARSDSLDLENEVQIPVRAKTMTRWISIGAGVQTNFGRVVSPLVSVDADFRIRVGPRDQDMLPGRLRLLVRVGAAWYGAGVAADDPLGNGGHLRMDLIPFNLALGVRHEWPTQALWVGLGALVAPYQGSSQYAGSALAKGPGILSPGFMAVAGYGVRVPGGEFGVELRGSTLTSQGSDLALSGQLGGLSALLTYRVAY